jgi:hypothetical protein
MDVLLAERSGSRRGSATGESDVGCGVSGRADPPSQVFICEMGAFRRQVGKALKYERVHLLPNMSGLYPSCPVRQSFQPDCPCLPDLTCKSKVEIKADLFWDILLLLNKGLPS